MKKAGFIFGLCALVALVYPCYLQATCVQGDCQNGPGAKKLEDGRTYVGNFISGMMDKKGNFTWDSGDKYEGTLRNGKREGQGVMTWKNGDIYNGRWNNDKRNVTGTMNWATGDSYTGAWKDDLMEGAGIMKWKSGDYYDGTWVAGKIDGFGTFIWKNGIRYAGEWKNGKMDGNGTLIQADFRVVKGKWSAGNPVSGTGTKKATISAPAGLYRLFCGPGKYDLHYQNTTFAGAGKAQFSVLRGEGKGIKGNLRWQIEGAELWIFQVDDKTYPMGDPEIYTYDNATKIYRGIPPQGETLPSCILKK